VSTLHWTIVSNDTMGSAHTIMLCNDHGDVATASLLETWVDEAERRAWFLFETTRRAEAPGA
jgi:DNA-binding ferritin-like protein